MLTHLDSCSVKYDSTRDLFLVEDSLASSSPLTSRPHSRDPTAKLCSELNKTFKMSVLAQQYIKGQVTDLSKRGSLKKGSKELPAPPYLVPDTTAMTENLKMIKDLLKTGDYVLIMPRAVWLGLDKSKGKNRKAREAIRWLESLTNKDDGQFRFQRAKEYSKIEFVKRPKVKTRDSWHVLEVIECCYSIAQRGVDARRNLIGKQYEDECQAWELSTVLLLVGGFDVNENDGGAIGTFLTDEKKAKKGEMTAMELAHSVGK